MPRPGWHADVVVPRSRRGPRQPARRRPARPAARGDGGLGPRPLLERLGVLGRRPPARGAVHTRAAAGRGRPGAALRARPGAHGTDAGAGLRSCSCSCSRSRTCTRAAVIGGTAGRAGPGAARARTRACTRAGARIRTRTRGRAAPAGVEPAPPPAPRDEFHPTHRAPSSGLATRERPDPGRRPNNRIEAGLDLQLIERADGWARVRCSNGWETWVDGRYLADL